MLFLAFPYKFRLVRVKPIGGITFLLYLLAANQTILLTICIMYHKVCQDVASKHGEPELWVVVIKGKD